MFSLPFDIKYKIVSGALIELPVWTIPNAHTRRKDYVVLPQSGTACVDERTPFTTPRPSVFGGDWGVLMAVLHTGINLGMLSSLRQVVDFVTFLIQYYKRYNLKFYVHSEKGHASHIGCGFTKVALRHTTSGFIRDILEDLYTIFISSKISKLKETVVVELLEGDHNASGVILIDSIKDPLLAIARDVKLNLSKKSEQVEPKVFVENLETEKMLVKLQVAIMLKYKRFDYEPYLYRRIHALTANTLKRWKLFTLKELKAAPTFDFSHGKQIGNSTPIPVKDLPVFKI